MKNLCLFIALLLLFNCKRSIFTDELSMDRTPYTSDKLKIDGYYYQSSGNNYFSLYCFYRNGIVLALGGTFSSQEEMDNYIQESFVDSQNYKEYRSNWGVFKIENESIRFERWHPGSGGSKAYVREGEIKNDTTFVITESYRMRRGKKKDVEEICETYHFKQFSPKPDSTNSFID